MTGRPSSDDLDAELTRRVDEQARIADTLTELENHPGLRLLQSAAPTGVTATRWADVQQLLAKLWTDLATHGARQRPMSCSRHGRLRKPVITSLHERMPKILCVSPIVRRANFAGRNGPA
jgi:hypothetical protein